MTILEEIRDGFASMTSYGAMKIKSLSDEYIAFIVRIPDGYGVAIPVDDSMEIAEAFNSCKFRTGRLAIAGTPANYLMLISAFEEFRYEFASLCAELLSPGKGGENRKLLLQSPLEWWKQWKELVGNGIKERAVYSIIAELYVFECKFRVDKSAEWTATHRGSHDIECSAESCEVKSTCRRYGAEISEGFSVNDMKKRLSQAGYDSGKLEIELQHQGLERGASIRDKRYKILEKRRYVVDESFPGITGKSFKENHLPYGITQIIYTVDLDAISYVTW